MTAFALPRNDQHVTIVGQNGSGKSQLAAFLLSMKDLRKERWIVIDHKREAIVQSLQNVRQIGFNEVPKQPGLYVLEATPDVDDDRLENFLWRIHKTERTGLWIDEGYMMPRQAAYGALLTQGRSKRIPIITLTQRPVKVNVFALSEAKHVVVFDLSRKRDWQTIEENTLDGFSTWLPPEYPNGLPEFHSRWFQQKQLFLFKPVPDAKTLIAKIDANLAPNRKWL